MPPAPGDPLPPGPSSALPPVTARVLAFLAIVLGGASGGLIGHALVDLQCRGSCAVPEALGMLVGAVVAAGGVAVLATLVLRAMGEWRSGTPVHGGRGSHDRGEAGGARGHGDGGDPGPPRRWRPRVPGRSGQPPGGPAQPSNDRRRKPSA